MDKNLGNLKKIIITGIPGTGKSSVAEVLASKLGWMLVDINEVAEQNRFYAGYDEERRCYIIDIERLCEFLKGLKKKVIIEGHVAHLCKGDVVIVLRCKPEVLRKRLVKKGWDREKVEENIEAEILDLITQEAIDINPKVYELDTTDLNPEKAASRILQILKNPDVARKHLPGSVSWEKELEDLSRKNNI